MREPALRVESTRIEIRGVLMRAAALHTSRVTGTRAIPDPLIRDLLIAVLLTDGGDKPSARSRLEQVLGKDLTDRLLTEPIEPARPAD
jgi:hypothetical protein